MSSNYSGISITRTSLSRNPQVEGLIKKGAMKPDDRPLWFDIYRAFPPTDEPKFSRPKTENKPIKQIFYPEDVMRAKFHAQKLGIGTVNMLMSTGDTPTKKLLQKYDKLKAEGLSEDEIIQKCKELIENEKQQTLSKRKTDLKLKSVTAQILTEVNMKNIFDATSEKENEK
ncbi:Probable 28S ribosomal protein S23, mitochondrial [Eumeta japonica]|uniref:Small ribosomal subunit protein mS23 n=1 Tax=Eumeta variegata TaxID=151549 RepID=A0A4C1ZHM8_EUMVA|nr:Probable 28S ribosomal protein S23, mitochondrial [Eumeta japonica]